MTSFNPQQRLAKALTLNEQRRLLEVTADHPRGQRDHALFSLALGTGLRAHEMLALNVGDVLTDDRQIRSRVQLRVFKGHARSPRPQEVIIPSTAQEHLRTYLELRRERGDTLESSTPLFRSRKGNRLSTRQLRHIFGVWQERAGFERRLSTHSLRHAACTNIYRATQDIRLTQRFARHASILPTAIYTHPSDEDLVRAVSELPC